MSQLRGESSAPEMSAANGDSAVLQTGLGGRRRAREAQEGPVLDAARPVARVRDPAPGPIPSHVPGLVSMPSLHGQLGLIGIHHQRLFRQYLNNSPMIPVRTLRDIEARRRLFVEGCRAREAAFDANPPEMDSDAVAFALAVTAAGAGSPLAD
ncbi:PREDICTED: EP300-interacting inhibitor of differentiation 2B [Chinchilla lanigera]|uniref:EP300-interacting inhibitor of differentiation 2B n=1 Tax=Chinchilla lanigera TaxID=34839 RepID=UPI00038E9F41|nr:PREDICTED: EP300-interacting inhibitor of differentiation 2B [Chinchilla lanigera]